MFSSKNYLVLLGFSKNSSLLEGRGGPNYNSFQGNQGISTYMYYFPERVQMIKQYALLY